MANAKAQRNAKAETTATTRTPWIRKAPLQRRWNDMPNSTFWDRQKRGLIPLAEFPFGPTVPYWRMSVIEAFEVAAAKTPVTRRRVSKTAKAGAKR
jgi:hypothetical protein